MNTSTETFLTKKAQTDFEELVYKKVWEVYTNDIENENLTIGSTTVYLPVISDDSSIKEMVEVMSNVCVEDIVFIDSCSCVDRNLTHLVCLTKIVK